jgi:hypothetical protein
MRLAKKRVQCLNEAWCFVSNSVLKESLVLRNPLLRQAPKRYEQREQTEPQQSRAKLWQVIKEKKLMEEEREIAQS